MVLMTMQSKTSLTMTYDSEADAAYINIIDEAERQITSTITSEVLNVDINYDLDKTGKIQGIEILGASRVLSIPTP